MFSGNIWTRREALEAGLIDGLGEMRDVLRQKYGKEVKIKEIGRRSSLLKRLLGRSSASAMQSEMENTLGNLPGQLLAAIEDRAFWSRFGL